MEPDRTVIGSTTRAVMEPERKRRRPRCARDEAVAAKIARWSEQCSPLPEDARERTRRQAKGSKKGCMKGKGGPQNASCRSRGVRQRKWGKWVAEIRLPNGRGRMWLGTFATEAEAATAYDDAAAAMYGPCARLNEPQREGNSNPAASPTLPGDHGDPTPALALVPEAHGDPPTFCVTVPEEHGDPEENVDAATFLALLEEFGDSTSCLTQPEGLGDPAYLSVSEGYGDPAPPLTLPELHDGLAVFSTGYPAHISPQACLGLPEFYGDADHLNVCPTYLGGPGVCNDPYADLPELLDDPTYFSMDEVCSGPAYVDLLEEHGGPVSITAPQAGSGDHAHTASATGSSSFIASLQQDAGGRSTGHSMENLQPDQINKTTDSNQHWSMGAPADAEKPKNIQCEDWLEDVSLEDLFPEMKDDWLEDFSLEDVFPEMKDDGAAPF